MFFLVSTMSIRVEENLFKSVFNDNEDLKLKKGDHIKVSLGVYEHHGIYTGEGTVVQRTQDGIDEVPLEEFSEGHGIEVVKYDDRLGKRKDVVRRARSHVGEEGYNLLFENCEHFANEMVSGSASSEQVDLGLAGVSSLLMPQWSKVNHPKHKGSKDPELGTVVSSVMQTLAVPAAPVGAIAGLVSEKSLKKTLKKAEKGVDKGIKEVEDVANVGINIVGDIVDGIKGLFK